MARPPVATATASDTERVLGLGADRVIDVEAGPVEAGHRGLPRRRRRAAGYGVLAASPLLSVVRGGGKTAGLLNALTDDALVSAGLTGVNVWALPADDVITRLLNLVAAAELRVDVTEVLVIEDAADACAHRGGHRTREDSRDDDVNRAFQRRPSPVAGAELAA